MADRAQNATILNPTVKFRVGVMSAVTLLDQIRQAAQEIANDMRTRVSDAERQLTEERLSKFPVQHGSDYLCPSCWVENGGLSPLKKIPSDTNDNLFCCGLCQYELRVPHV